MSLSMPSLFRTMAALPFVTSLAFAPTAQAQSADEASADHIVVGVGALFDRAPFKGAETQIFPIPLLSIRQGPVYIETTEIGASLTSGTDDLQVGGDIFVAARNRSGRDRSKLTADAGGRAWIASPLGKLSAEIRRDITGSFGGTEVIGRYSHAITAGKLTVTPAAQISWLDRKAANWLYGITTAQRATMIAKQRSVILPVAPITKHVFNLSADFSLAYAIDDRWSVLTVASSTYLGKPIRNSPAVGEKWQATFLTGVAYKF